MEVHGCKVPKPGRERKQSSRKQTQTEINTGWPSLQFQLGVMGSHIALVLDGSPWSGEARILLMRLTFQCNQTAAAAHKKSLRAWRISVAAAALQLSNSLKMCFYLICSWFTWRICFYRQEYFHLLPSQQLLEQKCRFWMKALIIV